MLLQKVNNEPDKRGSGGLLKVVICIAVLVAVIVIYQRTRTPSEAPAPASPETVSAASPSASPADDASSAPLVPSNATSSATPESVSSPAASPAAQQTEVAVEPSPAVAPAKTKDVTITEPVQIPVKDDQGKITGYINLQRGQVIRPVSVENDQIKLKSGKGFVFVPVSSTDMAH